MIDQKKIEKLIKKSHYWNNGKTTICILTLQSGFEIVGSSSVLDKREFDIEIGKKYARKQAFDKLAEHEAYDKQRIVNSELNEIFERTSAQDYIRHLLKKGKNFFELEENQIEGITKVVFDFRSLEEDEIEKLESISPNYCIIEIETRF